MKTQLEYVKVDAGIFGEIEVSVLFEYHPDEPQTLTTPYIKPSIDIIRVYTDTDVDLEITRDGYELIEQALKEKLNV